MIAILVQLLREAPSVSLWNTVIDTASIHREPLYNLSAVSNRAMRV